MPPAAAEPTVNPNTGLLTTHRVINGWRIEGTRIEIHPLPNYKGDRWTIHHATFAEQRWLTNNGLHRKAFPRRADALRAITAAHMIHTLPTARPPHYAKLTKTPDSTGHWTADNGSITIIRHPEGGYRIRMNPGGEYQAPTLRSVRQLIGAAVRS